MVLGREVALLVAFGFAAVMGAGTPAVCDTFDGVAVEGATLKSTEVYDVAQLPDGRLHCVVDNEQQVSRRLIGQINGRDFLVNLSSGSAGVAGEATVGDNGAEPDWYITCSYDATAARDICLLQKQDLNVFLVNGSTYVQVGKEHQAGAEILLRVDEAAPHIGEVIRSSELDASGVIKELLSGNSVRTRFTHRHSGRHDAVMSLVGFSEAFQLMTDLSGAYRR